MGAQLPGSAGDQREKLIDRIACSSPAGEQIEKALSDEAQAEHFDDGAQGTEEEKKHLSALLVVDAKFRLQPAHATVVVPDDGQINK